MDLFLSMQPAVIPVYTARDLGNLPPLSAFDNDVIALHKEVGELKQSMSVIRECKDSIASLTKEMRQMKQKKPMRASSTSAGESQRIASPTTTATAPSLASSSDEGTTSMEASTSCAGHTSQDAAPNNTSNTLSSPSNEQQLNEEPAQVALDTSQPSSEQQLNEEPAQDALNTSQPAAASSEIPDAPGPSNIEQLISEERSVIENEGQRNRSTSETSLGSSYEVIDSVGPSASESETSDSDSDTDTDTDTSPGASTQNLSNSPQIAAWRGKSNPRSIYRSDSSNWRSSKSGTDNAHASKNHANRARRTSQAVSPRAAKSGHSRTATGSCSTLKAFRQFEESSRHENRHISGVFISRMEKKTSCSQVATHVRKELQMTVRPEKIESKCGRYSSFYIRCNRVQRQDLLDANLWPSGATMKPYFS